jgi:DNA polymerase-3 subunit delta'
MLTEIQHQTEGVKFLKRFVEGRLVSPLLLIGPSGVGRRFSVLKAAQEAFCTETREPECPCSSCYTINKGIHPDVITLPATEKDIGIDDIRQVINEAKSYPSVSNVRCFVIDGADRFTIPAANAFLKTLEEPPARSRFFLIAEDIDRVLPTIRSRCGLVRYLPLPEAFVLSIVQRYEESAKALVYTRMGEGSVGDAIRYWGAGRLTLRDQILNVLQLALKKDLPLLFSAVDTLDRDLLLALKFLEQILHDVLIVRVDTTKAIHADRLDALKELGKKVTPRIWSGLARKIKDLQVRHRTTRLNLPFHFKTILVETL